MITDETVNNLVQLWQQFEVETRETRKINTKGSIYKPQFSDFINWLQR